MREGEAKDDFWDFDVTNWVMVLPFPGGAYGVSRLLGVCVLGWGEKSVVLLYQVSSWSEARSLKE